MGEGNEKEIKRGNYVPKPDQRLNLISVQKAGPDAERLLSAAAGPCSRDTRARSWSPPFLPPQGTRVRQGAGVNKTGM